MQVTNFSDVARRPRRIAVGEFDGVHLGHREVIRGNDTVLTFEPHPLGVVHPERAPKLLTSFDIKVELIAQLGVQELVVIPFDTTFAAHTPSEFIDEILVGRLGATHVSVGTNFHFGHDATGDTAMLSADPRFETRVVPLVEAEGGVVSSSRIRTLVAEGEVTAAGRLLGAPFRIRGEVVAGDRRGRELGFPTANLVPNQLLACPGHGVYACRVSAAVAAQGLHGAMEHMAAVNVGVRPTFQTSLGLLVEAYVLDFTGDLYGHELTIEFVEQLRGEWRFDSVDALVAQMTADVAETRARLGA
jgi:riboflavin kinase/FMN adenylyltransferase